MVSGCEMTIVVESQSKGRGERNVFFRASDIPAYLRRYHL
jgi:hypothetical protein